MFKNTPRVLLTITLLCQHPFGVARLFLTKTILALFLLLFLSPSFAARLDGCVSLVNPEIWIVANTTQSVPVILGNTCNEVLKSFKVGMGELSETRREVGSLIDEDEFLFIMKLGLGDFETLVVSTYDGGESKNELLILSRDARTIDNNLQSRLAELKENFTAINFSIRDVVIGFDPKWEGDVSQISDWVLEAERNLESKNFLVAQGFLARAKHKIEYLWEKFAAARRFQKRVSYAVLVIFVGAALSYSAVRAFGRTEIRPKYYISFFLARARFLKLRVWLRSLRKGKWKK